MRQRRSLSYRKGKETIKRKAKELSILCDIPVCAVITSPNGETETWPTSLSELKPIFQMYREKIQFFDRQGYGDPAEDNYGKGTDEIMLFDHDPADENYDQETEEDDEDEIMEWLNDKILAVNDRIRVLKEIDVKKLPWRSGSVTEFQSDCTCLSSSSAHSAQTNGAESISIGRESHFSD
ncbi:hypothetical protein M9H77_34744 [Catharanthus roseus]|uniref:Uncharacterized protein n=1 Tax=Catharanthus roseus TaxID=4058 RepID=A0ACB9ZM17_CATRO|nr:hypothetical protein M9H77_34744 [Catharanthus roseus]